MVVKLDLVYDRQVNRVRSQITSAAVAYWNGMGSWRDADYERLVAKLVPRIEAGQQKIADLTDAYIRQLAIAEFGTAAAGMPLNASTSTLRGVAAAEVYHRPFASAYTALGEGKSVAGALELGRQRLQDVVSTGMQLSKTHSAREALSKTRFVGYQRVLTGRENCGLCVIASTQRYNKGDLLPIHPACDCEVKPLHGERSTQIINQRLLDDTYAEIASKLDHRALGLDGRDLGLGKTDPRGRPLSDFTDLIVTNEHSEIGPILSWRDHQFTSAADIAALAR